MHLICAHAQKLEALASTGQAACHNSQVRAFNARGQGRASDPLRPLQAESGPKVGTLPPVTGRLRPHHGEWALETVAAWDIAGAGV